MLLGLLPALAVGASADAGTAPRTQEFRTPTIVRQIAMDGPRVAYAGWTSSRHCPRIYVWNVLNGQRTAVSHLRTCNVTELAVAGRRVAWIVHTAGNTEETDKLYVSSLPTAKERLLARTARYAEECSANPRCWSGTWIQGLVGSDSLLAVSRWTTDTKTDVQRFTRGGLDVIGSDGLRRVVAGQDGIVAAAADSGHVAVLRTAGDIDETYQPADVVIYASTGKLLKRLTPAGIGLRKPGQMAQIALSGIYLAVLTVEPKLELYNWRTGALLHSKALPRGAAHLALSGQTAAYLVTRYGTSLVLHVVQARTGRDVVLARLKQPPATSGFVGVDIDELGLVYASDARAAGRSYSDLEFVPMARIRSALAGRK